MTDETADEVVQSRRGLLRGVAVAGAACALVGPLAACGSSSSNAGDQGGSPTGGGGGDQHTGVITKTSEVALHGGKVVIVSGTKVVVTQPTAGTYKAFTAICTHQGCTVNRIDNDLIKCPCHGSEFDATTGAVRGGPARAPLASIPIAVQSGTISFA